MQVHHLSIPRTARYAVLGDPAGPIREIWMVCHGYGQLAARFLTHFRILEAPHRLVVAPEALSRFYLDHHTRTYERAGASWMTKEDRDFEIADQIGYLDRVWEAVCVAAAADPATVALVGLGFSQGASTVARWVDQSPRLAERPHRVQRLLTWANGLPRDLDLEAARPVWLDRARYTLVLGDRDPFATPERVAEIRAALDTAGVPYTFVPFDGEHRMNPAVLRALVTPPS